MTYKEKLIDLLKTDEQVRTAMEKLEFGCKFIFDGIEFIYSGDKNADESILEGIESGDTKIIGLPLQERFIRMYCKNKKINIAFSNTELWHLNGDVILPIICKLDNTKDFDNQEDSVYKKIYEALLELNK